MLAERILKGDVRAASRLMRAVDDADPAAIPELKALFPHTGQAQVIGLTGSPGTGKSTLADRLIGHFRQRGKTVGVVAVDPTSPFSGGAILGDRIRMQAHATDPGVFIRSLATRGSLGGLSRATSDVVRVLEAMKKDVVLVETVGVGQDEVEVARLARTTVVVLAPGMGDEIQAIKAGILEVADVFAVNKADREGADRTIKELMGMLDLKNDQGGAWRPPVIKTVALSQEGIEDLAEAIERHQAFLKESGQLEERERARAKVELLARLKARLLEGALSSLDELGGLDEIAGRIARREEDPYELGEALAARLRAQPSKPAGDR
jgi:LAO/AO transport system kinase